MGYLGNDNYECGITYSPYLPDKESFFKRLFKKLFLVKEIKSKKGVLHFRRWRIIECPFFNIYIHHILKSDLDLDCHDHPWDFTTFILKNGYTETTISEGRFVNTKYTAFSRISHVAKVSHKITLLHNEPTWTLCITGKSYRKWGYTTLFGGWMDHTKYREYKRTGKCGCE